MPLGLIDALVPLVCLSCSLFLYTKPTPTRKNSKEDRSTRTWRPQSYLLHNEVTHGRLLPKEAENAFTYPTLSLLVSLDALELRRLDLGSRGWVFGYGGRWWRLAGLRSAPYLTPGTGSIRGKLEDVLAGRGYLREGLRDAWMMTMPSFLGFEGINPLTVYFCYDADGALWLTVLEVSTVRCFPNCRLIKMCV